MQRMEHRRSLFVVLLALASSIVLILSVETAFAGDQGGKAQGNATAQSTVTEDNDSDGVPNEPDPSGDADNKHPSGKDKHAEAGGSGNQGAAASTPDQDGRGPDRDEGGTDKPDGPGGADILDQDGNNGCGNDDDFDDDNEGLCGGPAVSAEVVTPPSDSEVGGVRTTREEKSEEVASVLGVRLEREEAPEAEVLGARLARTGWSVLPFAIIGLTFVALGMRSRVIGRRRAYQHRTSSSS